MSIMSDHSTRIGGDYIEGGKFGGDQIGGDKYVFNNIQQLLRSTPIPYSSTVLGMVERYAAVFGGRDHELVALDTWLEHGTSPYALLIAPTGRGKTALLIHWVARIQQRGHWTVVFAPISLRYQTAKAESTLGALASAL